MAVHDAADVVDPGHAVGVRVAERRQHLLGGIDLAWRDEQIGVGVAAVLAGRVEQRGERRALEQQGVDARRLKRREDLGRRDVDLRGAVPVPRSMTRHERPQRIDARSRAAPRGYATEPSTEAMSPPCRSARRTSGSIACSISPRLEAIRP